MFAYTKICGNETLVVILNFTKETVLYEAVPRYERMDDYISNYPPTSQSPNLNSGSIELRPWEALVVSTS